MLLLIGDHSFSSGGVKRRRVRGVRLDRDGGRKKRREETSCAISVEVSQNGHTTRSRERKEKMLHVSNDDENRILSFTFISLH